MDVFDADSGSTYVLVDVVDMRTDQVVASLSRFIAANSPTDWQSLTFEVGVPDFESPKSYYVRMGSSNVGSLNPTMIINRVRGFG